jgi:biopolymer transport protein TolR
LTNASRRRGSRRSDLPVNAEINVTSLIDVAFTLLVIFIITAPMLQGGLEVRLPQAQIRPIDAQDDPFIVSVDADGQIFVGETPVTREEFAASFRQLFDMASPNAVYIKGDEAAMYGWVFQVQAIVYEVAAEEGVVVRILGEPEHRR